MASDTLVHDFLGAGSRDPEVRETMIGQSIASRSGEDLVLWRGGGRHRMVMVSPNRPAVTAFI
jgi:hypothetical protein